MSSSYAASAADLPMAVVAEDELVARVRARDVDALASVYDAHHVAVRLLARRLVGDESIAEDLVHDTFVALPGAMRRFRGSSALRTFIMGIAVNRARKYIRAAGRRRAAYERHAAQPPPPDAPAPDVALARRELAAALHRALDALPHDQRIAFVLCEIDELTSSAAAAIVGCPEETIRTRLYHARRKLRARLEAEDVR
ncbi:MAG TPA: RNA polymerase sigma factor [Kofleriaceae bacterium]